MTLIVGIGNKARAGKDCAGQAVLGYYENQRKIVERFYRTSASPVAKLYKFATALYKECREQHGMTEKDPVLLQNVGMTRRQEDRDYWVRQVERAIDFDKPDIAVITDVRFLNEGMFVKARGGVMINVQRLNPDGTSYIADDRPADHPSEVQLDAYHWDHLIRCHTGEAVLVGDLAITIVEFERARRK